MILLPECLFLFSTLCLSFISVSIPVLVCNIAAKHYHPLTTRLPSRRQPGPQAPGCPHGSPPPHGPRRPPRHPAAPERGRGPPALSRTGWRRRPGRPAGGAPGQQWRPHQPQSQHCQRYSRPEGVAFALGHLWLRPILVSQSALVARGRLCCSAPVGIQSPLVGVCQQQTDTYHDHTMHFLHLRPALAIFCQFLLIFGLFWLHAGGFWPRLSTCGIFAPFCCGQPRCF